VYGERRKRSVEGVKELPRTKKGGPEEEKSGHNKEREGLRVGERDIGEIIVGAVLKKTKGKAERPTVAESSPNKMRL